MRRELYSMRGGYTQDSDQLFLVPTEERGRKNKLTYQQKGKLTAEGVLHRKMECD